MDEDNGDHIVSSRAKEPAANRRNAQLSTGPRTEQGKNRSRRNALKHGILASALLITKGAGAEDPAEFEELLDSLHRDLAPVGALEEMLVEKIAVCLWRQKRALKCEAGLVRRAFVPDSPAICSKIWKRRGHSDQTRNGKQLRIISVCLWVLTSTVSSATKRLFNAS